MLAADPPLPGLTRTSSLSSNAPTVPSSPHLHRASLASFPKQMERPARVPDVAVAPTPPSSTAGSSVPSVRYQAATVAPPSSQARGGGIQAADAAAQQAAATPAGSLAAELCSPRVSAATCPEPGLGEDDAALLSVRRASCSEACESMPSISGMHKSGSQGMLPAFAASAPWLPSRAQQITAISQLRQPLAVVTQKKSLIRCGSPPRSPVPSTEGESSGFLWLLRAARTARAVLPDSHGDRHVAVLPDGHHLSLGLRQ